ncbi:EAL domain-containing protein [Rhizohabitans arisaemae]|uniref:EAL domain-containing protein n=1 Tax=Rhizohabitans arisaemae TaxID=2720610 RepID=UPI0024B24168|nr:EAL domain-containing protein [Rhizohabitans arisaemae]
MDETIMIGRRDFHVPLAAAAGLGAAGLLGVLAAGGVTPGVLFLAGLLSSFSLFVFATRVSTPRRAALRWLGAGVLAWAGAIGVRISMPALDRAASVSYSDLFLLAATVLLAVGCVRARARPIALSRVLRHLADSYLCMAGLFLIVWVIWLGEPYAESGETPGGFLLKMSLPLIGLIVTCGVAPLVLAGRTTAAALGGLVCLAALTLTEAVLVVTRLTAGTAVPPGAAAPGALTLIAFLLLAVAPWNGRLVRHTHPIRRSLIAILPPVTVGGATVVLTWSALAGPGHRVAAVVPILAASVVLLLLSRFFLLLASTVRLRRGVASGERHLRELAESTGDLVLVADYEGVVREASAGVTRTYGYDPAELVGRPMAEFVHPEDVPDIEAALRAFAEYEAGRSDAGAGGGPTRVCKVSCRVRASDGTWRPTESVATGYPGREFVIITARDVAEQEALRRQVTHLTFHDGITGLPNRAYFEERTRDVLERRPSQVAVVFLDLDGFTAVNDSVGHASGDYLLGQAARRLRAAVQPQDTLVRWGGDEFAVLVDAHGVVDLAERLVRTVSSDPFRVAERDIALTASVGVAFAEEGIAPGDLIRNADVAMARAKELGGRRVEVFAAHMHADVVRRLELAADLQRALSENQFSVEYQPVVDLATSRVIAVEALARWWRGSGFVPPEQFLGLAEDTGLIVPLSERILRDACREVAAWRASSWEIGLCLNLSARQIRSPRFVETVASALAESGLPPSALTLEVIEEMLVEDSEEIVARLSDLRAMGIRLAIDDFGTGYASLAYLRQLPVDMIKIDPSFVAGLGTDETLTLLTQTIVRLGHELGLIVVAEGIERPEQLELLKELGCTRGQGFLVARPMAPRRVETLIESSLSTCPIQTAS